MKKLLTLTLGLALVFSLGCERTETTASNDEGLNFDVIGDDAPESLDAAISELAEFDIAVPDPVTDEQMHEVQVWSGIRDLNAGTGGTLVANPKFNDPTEWPDASCIETMQARFEVTYSHR